VAPDALPSRLSSEKGCSDQVLIDAFSISDLEKEDVAQEQLNGNRGHTVVVLMIFAQFII